MANTITGSFSAGAINENSSISNTSSIDKNRILAAAGEAGLRPVSDLGHTGPNVSVTFPELVNNVSWIPQYTYITAFDTFQRYRSKADTTSDEKKSDPFVVLSLPLPRELNVAYRSDWQTLDLGNVEGFRSGSVSIDDWKTLAAEGGTTTVSNFLKGAGLMSMANPYRVLDWRGPQQRVFAFSWDLNPTSASESEDLNKVIWAFKKYMHTASAAYPTDGGSASLRQPPLWNLTFVDRGDNNHSGNKFLFKVADAALTNLEVEYTPRGHAWHNNNAPLGVRIHTTWTETTILTQNDFGKNYQSTYNY